MTAYAGWLVFSAFAGFFAAIIGALAVSAHNVHAKEEDKVSELLGAAAGFFGGFVTLALLPLIT